MDQLARQRGPSSAARCLVDPCVRADPAAIVHRSSDRRQKLDSEGLGPIWVDEFGISDCQPIWLGGFCASQADQGALLTGTFRH